MPLPVSRVSVLPAILLLLASAIIGGCLQPEESSSRFEARAENGVMFQGWDYAAATKTRTAATLEIDVDEVENTGLVKASGFIGNKTFSIRLDTFAHNADDFHSGGIAANFDEHGDSGVGNTLLPRMFLLLATWGPGQFIYDDNATVDNYTGTDVWDAHLMVTNTGVRDDATGEVRASGGLYDPAAPGDAVIGDDLEAHLVLTSTFEGDDHPPINETFDGQVDLPTEPFEMTFEVPVAPAKFRIVIDIGTDPGEIGPYTFQFKNAEATVLASKTINGAGVIKTVTLEGETGTAGTHTLVGHTSSTPASFTAEVGIEFPPKPVHYFFWEDVTVNQRVVP